ncbi:MAG: DNA internalization-related competence protein ComEC/Rec2 [Burkholderiales bacterium]
MRGNILSFVLGVLLLQQHGELPDLWPAVSLAPLAFLVWWLKTADAAAPKAVRRMLLGAFFMAAGFFWAALLAEVRLADNLPAAWEGRDIALIGVIAGLPQENERGVRFDFDVERVAPEKAGAPDRIALNWYKDRRDANSTIPKLAAGERWRLTVRLKRPHGNANPHGFDYEVWLLERSIRATGYVREGANRRLAELVWRPGYVIDRAREHVRRRLLASLDGKPYAGVITALVIGDQNAISRSDWDLFQRTGVTHLMSISGLHVTMLSGLAAVLIYWLWRTSAALTLRLPARKAAAAAGALVALLYALLAGFAVPTQRTLIMLWVVVATLWTARSSSASAVLCLALFVVVLFDPWSVLAPGFWLSFGAIALIMLVATNRVARSGWLTTWGRAQWAVTVGLLAPLLALFQQVSLIAPIANLFAIPVISLIVVPLSLIGAAVPFSVSFHPVLLLAHEILDWLMALLRLFDGLPQTIWQQHAPAPWTLVAGLAGAIWLLLPRGFPARWIGIVALAPMCLVKPARPGDGELWLTVLDVGQGLAVLAQTGHHALLYDSGPAFNSEVDAGNRIVAPYLLAAGINELSGMIVSHDDADHSGGAVSVLRALPTAWLASSLPAPHVIQAHAAQSIQCFAGQQWQWDGVRFEVLHPTLESYQDATLKDNARGCVLKITSRFGAVLLPADIEKDTELEIVKRTDQALAADLLVAPHHGSKTSSSAAFVNVVQPDAVIFSMAYRNPFGHPRDEVVQRYLDIGAQTFRSDQDGALSVRFTRKGISIGAYRQESRRYWRTLNQGQVRNLAIPGGQR